MEAKPYKIPHPFRKLKKELIDTIVADIARGSTHRLAAEANGISVSILNMWRKQGEVDFYHEVDSLAAYLVVSLAKVKQKEVERCRKAISSKSKGHKGAEWTLEHAYQRDFSSNSSIQELSEEIEELKSMIKKGDSDNEEQVDSEGAH